MMDENPSAAMADKTAAINAELKRNPPAFPVAVPSDFQFVHEGMTLRDWFAGQALAGLCADCNAYLPPREMARASYDLADALLAARGPQ